MVWPEFKTNLVFKLLKNRRGFAMLLHQGINVWAQMSRKGPVAVEGKLDFVEDIFVGVKSH